MQQSNPLRFWKISPDGQNALVAYEHIVGYGRSVTIQYERAYDLWRASSNLGDDPSVFHLKHDNMRQVVRDIHFLLISLQVVWKSLQRFCDGTHFPSFTASLTPLRKKWEPYFEQYREPRNTFEHYDDQIFGPDSRNNSPGYGVKLNSSGSFALGSHQPVLLNDDSRKQFGKFMEEFENAITSVVGPLA